MDEPINKRTEKETGTSPQTAPYTRRYLRSESFLKDRFTRHVDCLREIFSGTSLACLTRIAENASMPGAMLEQLSFHREPAVREAVADNCNTPIDTLWALVYDECADVRYALAENHNLPLALLSALSEDENPYIAMRAQLTIDRLLGGRLFSPEFWEYFSEKEQCAAAG